MTLTHFVTATNECWEQKSVDTSYSAWAPMSVIREYSEKVGSDWVGLGAWFCADVVYPPKH